MTAARRYEVAAPGATGTVVRTDGRQDAVDVARKMAGRYPGRVICWDRLANVLVDFERRYAGGGRMLPRTNAGTR